MVAYQGAKVAGRAHEIPNVLPAGDLECDFCSHHVRLGLFDLWIDYPRRLRHKRAKVRKRSATCNLRYLNPLLRSIDIFKTLQKDFSCPGLNWFSFYGFLRAKFLVDGGSSQQDSGNGRSAS